MDSFFPFLESGLGHVAGFGPLGISNMEKQRLEKHVYTGACPSLLLEALRSPCEEARASLLEYGRPRGVRGSAIPAVVPTMWGHPPPSSPRKQAQSRRTTASPQQFITVGSSHYASEWFVTQQRLADLSRGHNKYKLQRIKWMDLMTSEVKLCLQR